MYYRSSYDRNVMFWPTRPLRYHPPESSLCFFFFLSCLDEIADTVCLSHVAVLCLLVGT